MVGNPFVDGSAVQPQGEGRYAGRIDELWNLRPLPQGGLVAAIALRAMAAELDDPAQRLRVAHTTFAAQVTSGPVDVDVELLRRGRSMSHLRAEVRNPGSPRGHLTTGIFGASRRGYDLTDLRPPPDVPHPDDCPSFRDPPPEDWEDDWEPMPFWEQVIHGRGGLGPSALGGLRAGPGRRGDHGTRSTTRRCGTTAPSTRSPSSWPPT